MRALLVCLLALGTLAMGGRRPDVPGTAGSAEPYHARFRELGNLYGAVFVAHSVTFAFRSFFGSTIGMCRFSSNGRNHVDLSTSAWNRGSEVFREMLVFHELGHCLLGRGHKNSRHGDGRPESLMNSWLFNERTYTANRDQYLKELYTAESAWSLSLQDPSRISFKDCGFGRVRGDRH